jgi:hypothetical protein
MSSRTEGFLFSPFKKGRCLAGQRDLLIQIPLNPPLIKGETNTKSPFGKGGRLKEDRGIFKIKKLC